MTQEEIDSIIKELKPYTKNTLLTEMWINGIGEIEIEIETEDNVNTELLKSVFKYVIKDLESIKTKANMLLNAMATIKGFKIPNNQSHIEFSLVGITINNTQNIHNQFKLVFSYNNEIIHINEDTLGYRTINFSGSKNNYYISGTSWKY